jgi:hypothetical protein
MTKSLCQNKNIYAENIKKIRRGNLAYFEILHKSWVTQKRSTQDPRKMHARSTSHLEQHFGHTELGL